MTDLTMTPAWHTTFRGGHIGVLLMNGIDNTGGSNPLQERKRALETRLRADFGHLTRPELLQLDVLRAYRDYYKRFDATYHVQLQLESVLHKGKSLPTVSPVVDAAFLAELDTLVLTASHDADAFLGRLKVDATAGREAFQAMNGHARQLRAGDVMMADDLGVVCSILTGQDQRTRVTPTTTRALFVAYAPVGVGVADVWRQLALIEHHVRAFAPHATVERADVHEAHDGS